MAEDKLLLKSDYRVFIIPSLVAFVFLVIGELQFYSLLGNGWWMYFGPSAFLIAVVYSYYGTQYAITLNSEGLFIHQLLHRQQYTWSEITSISVLTQNNLPKIKMTLISGQKNLPLIFSEKDRKLLLEYAGKYTITR